MASFGSLAQSGAWKFSGKIAVNLNNEAEALECIASRLSQRRGFNLFTLNLDHLVKIEKSPQFRDAYQKADLVTADGWPVVWMLKRQGLRAQRVTGADLVEPICALAAKMGSSIYFVGPGLQSQAKAVEILYERYQGLRIAGCETPQIPDPSDSKLVATMANRLNASGAQLCFLSLGAPKQEILAQALRPLCPQIGFICVGAALDFISGSAVRAPKMVQKTHMEWAWRMLAQPRRLGGRYLECMAFFAAAVGRSLLNSPAVVRGEMPAEMHIDASSVPAE